LGDRLGLLKSTPHHNLPTCMTEFVGRQPEIETLHDLLDANRLVTLVGPGGVGKTRLAIRIAEDKFRYFQDGIFFVALAPISTPDLIISVIAESLQFEFSGSEDPKVQLLNYLADKELLLIIDNFEHVIDGAPTVDDIIAASAETSVIVTSRERLNLKEESIFEVSGMRFPVKHLKSYNDVMPENYSAVKLFIRSALRVNPEINLNDENKSHILHICKLVDGLPLALELAAAWTRVISLDEIAQEIENNIDFLATTQSNIPKRHQSVRAAFDYSWNLLTHDEQDILGKLCIFRGGFTRETAGIIAEASLKNLSVLLNKSLLYRDASGRFYILEVLRQFGEEKLEKNSEDYLTIKSRFVNYFARFAFELFDRHRDTSPKIYFKKVSAEIDNIRFGLEVATESPDIDVLDQYVVSLDRYFSSTGLILEWDQYLKRIPELYDGQTAPNESHAAKWEELKAKALICRANIAHHMGDLASAKKCFDACYILFTNLKLDRFIANALNGLGITELYLGNHEKAKTYFHDCIALRRKKGLREDLMTALNRLALTETDLGNREDARKYLDESLQLSRELKDRDNEALTLNNLCLVIDDPVIQRQYLNESLMICEEQNSVIGQTRAMMNLGTIETNLGNFDTAMKLHEQCLRIYREIHYKVGIANVLQCLGLDHLNMQELLLSQKYFEESLKIFEEINYRQGISYVLLSLAGIRVHQKRYTEAQEMIQRAYRISKDINYVRMIGYAALDLGEIYAIQGQYSKAETALAESVAMFEKLGNQQGLARANIESAMLNLWLKQPDKAKQFLDRSIEIVTRFNLDKIVISNLILQGFHGFASGDYSNGLERFREALENARQNNKILEAKDVLLGIAMAWAEMGNMHKSLTEEILKTLMHEPDVSWYTLKILRDKLPSWDLTGPFEETDLDDEHVLPEIVYKLAKRTWKALSG